MDKTTTTARLSAALHITPHEVTSLLQALAITVRDAAVASDHVAIPGFGTFAPVKHNERIVSDLANPGTRMLLPPEIVLDFNPGAMLKKRLKNG